MRRYPLEPLAAAMGLSLHQACRSLGVSGTTQKDYRTRGVTELVADRMAVRAGFHPAEVWPDYGMEPCEECGTMFLPTHPRRRFCSRSCSSRQWQRQKYQTDPAFRDAERADRRRRYVECADYERGRQRRYRSMKREARA